MINTRYYFPAALCLLLALLSVASCSLNAPMQGRGEPGLQGEWQQDTSSAQKKLLNYSLYNFNFNCDSFFVQMHSFSKVNYGADTCMGSGRWTEYAKGSYTVRHDTLTLKGFFTHANWKLKDPGGCFSSGVYEEHFKIIKKTDSLYQFSATSSVMPFTLRLIKRVTCNPKPL